MTAVARAAGAARRPQHPLPPAEPRRRDLFLDFAKPESMALLQRLAGPRDVGIGSFGHGVLARRGLGFARLGRTRAPGDDIDPPLPTEGDPLRRRVSCRNRRDEAARPG